MADSSFVCDAARAAQAILAMLSPAEGALHASMVTTLLVGSAVGDVAREAFDALERARLGAVTRRVGDLRLWVTPRLPRYDWFVSVAITNAEVTMRPFAFVQEGDLDVHECDDGTNLSAAAWWAVVGADPRLCVKVAN